LTDSLDPTDSGLAGAVERACLDGAAALWWHARRAWKQL